MGMGMGIVLAVLNVIGMTLLIILYVFLGLLALAVVLLLAVCFSPISYKADVAVKGEGEYSSYKPVISLKGSWLFGILRFGYTGGGFAVKVLWFNILKNKGKEETGEERETEADDADGEANESTEQRGFAEKAAGTWSKYKAKYDSVVNHPDRQAIWDMTVDFAKREWRAVKPRMFRVTGRFGLDSPDKTGYAVGAAGVAKTLTGLNIKLAGDFDRQMVDITASVQDRLMFFSVAYPLLMYCLRKPIRPIVFGLMR
jgi:hypothetical protein